MSEVQPNTSIAGKRSAALASVGSGVLLTVLKLIVGFATGSIGILAEAAHSTLDLVAATVTFTVVHVADLPPDENHPYGHARAENLGALAEATLLSITAIWVLWKAYERIFISPVAPEVTIWSFAVMGISLVVDWFRSRALRRAAEKYNSPALAADAANFSNDMLGTSGVLLGLIIITLYYQFGIVPQWLALRADAFAAVGVAIIAIVVASRFSTRAVRALMDDIPHDLHRQLARITESVPGVLTGSARVRARFVGQKPFVDVTFQVPRIQSLEEAHQVTEAVEAAIQADLPDADVMVHVEPARVETEEYTTAVYAAASRLGLSVHNLDVFILHDGVRVDLDLELPADLTLAKAHAYSERLETAIRAELPGSTIITIHLEPRRDTVQPAVRFAAVQQAVNEALDRMDERSYITSVDALLVDGGVVVALRCAFPPDELLTTAHETMAKVERELRRAVPNIMRVQIDPEPVDQTYQH